MDAPAVVVARPLPAACSPRPPPSRSTTTSRARWSPTPSRRPPAPSARTPFAAELPKVAAAPTTDSPTSTTQAAAATRHRPPKRSPRPCRRRPATTPSSPSRSAATGPRPAPSAALAGVTLQLYDGVGAPTTPVAGLVRHLRLRRPTATARSSCRTRRPHRREPRPALLGRPDGHADRLVRPEHPADRGERRRSRRPPTSSAPATSSGPATPTRRPAPTPPSCSATGNTNNAASGGIWQTSRNNPSLPGDVRPQRRPRARPVRLGGRLARLAEDRGEDVHELAGRHAVAGWRCSPSPPRRRPTRPTTRTARSPPCRPRPAPTR